MKKVFAVTTAPKYPPPCAPERREELKRLLLTLAKRTTERGTLTELADKLGIGKHYVSRWIRAGEVPPYRARDMLRLENANPRGEKQITRQQLTPSLF